MQHGSLAIVSRKLARLGAIRTRLLPVARWPCCWQSLIRGGPGLAPARSPSRSFAIISSNGN
jgi:hypothetical protein